jgi:hypothetical protein
VAAALDLLPGVAFVLRELKEQKADSRRGNQQQAGGDC